MNKDRELLELAAISYDFELGEWDEKLGCWWDKDGMDTFNPLQDDGDGARLEAYLKLNVEWCGSFVLVSDSESSIECSEHYISHDDDQAARRTASVRVAAEIQRAKEAA